MPGLKPSSGGGGGSSCCVCEENGCAVALSSKGDTILFVDAEEAVPRGPRCDCIIALRRGDGGVDVYAVELKGVSAGSLGSAAGWWRVLRGALEPDAIREKCGSCLRWAESIVKGFHSAGGGARVRGHCVLVIPEDALGAVFTLVRRERRRYEGGLSARLLLLGCGGEVTDSFPAASPGRS